MNAQTSPSAAQNRFKQANASLGGSVVRAATSPGPGGSPECTGAPVTLLICALGGEGGGLLTEWLVDIARASGYAAQSTSIPGVAQRTGATTYYLEVFPLPVAQLGGKRPVFSLTPVPGAIDAMVSSELLETARQIGNGMASADRTLVITSSSRTFTTQERMVPGDGRTSNTPLLDVLRSHSREHHVLDMAGMARASGTVVSAVMLGAIAGSGLFPFERSAFEAVIQASGKGAQQSVKGFSLGFAQVTGQRSHAAMVADMLATPQAPAQAAGAIAASVLQEFPAAVHPMLSLGLARVTEYQDAAYGELYLQRLRKVLAAERQADTGEEHGYATTREMARWLALWMAFDDIVRVADLKSRMGRWQRVVGEVKAQEGDLLHVYDHFKPGAAEFAALLPTALAGRVLQWDKRRVARGKEPWALPLKVGTHSVFGMASLRLLANLKWLRVRGSRFAIEQGMLERWLDAVLVGTSTHWRLGHEIALCGRLIKGYGATNERGKDNLLHVIDHLATSGNFASQAARAQAIAQARIAALADEAGKALDQALLQHGAPARPVKAQPIRWVKTPPGRRLNAGKR